MRCAKQMWKYIYIMLTWKEHDKAMMQDHA
jgi:hypothetical protein